MNAEIGIIGGSGFYSMIDKAEQHKMNNEYGIPSDVITSGTISGKKVAFLPRHGARHTIPPHKVPYRANIESLYSMGVTRIIATNAIGSLKEEYRPGELVLFDQFVNMTSGRHDTFFDKDVVMHVSPAEPYCRELRKAAEETLEKLSLPYHKTGTVVVINGPRFSTKAESRYFAKLGFDVINMTQYPEVMLAKERAMCYLGIGMVTDYDVGLEGRSEIKPVSAEEVGRIFAKNIEKTKKLIMGIIPNIPTERTCGCAKSLEGALQTKQEK